MTMYYLLTDQQPTTLISSQYQLGFFKNTVLFTCMKDELAEYLKYFNKWIRYFADIIAFVQAGCQSRDITYCSNPTKSPRTVSSCFATLEFVSYCSN